jgi:hypothetical protein
LVDSQLQMASHIGRKCRYLWSLLHSNVRNFLIISSNYIHTKNSGVHYCDENHKSLLWPQITQNFVWLPYKISTIFKYLCGFFKITKKLQKCLCGLSHLNLVCFPWFDTKFVSCFIVTIFIVKRVQNFTATIILNFWKKKIIITQRHKFFFTQINTNFRLTTQISVTD